MEAQESKSTLLAHLRPPPHHHPIPPGNITTRMTSYGCWHQKHLVTQVWWILDGSRLETKKSNGFARRESIYLQIWWFIISFILISINCSIPNIWTYPCIFSDWIQFLLIKPHSHAMKFQLNSYSKISCDRKFPTNHPTKSVPCGNLAMEHYLFIFVNNAKHLQMGRPHTIVTSYWGAIHIYPVIHYLAQ